MAKDFSSMNTGRVFNTINQATTNRGQQAEAGPEEQAARIEQRKTQGRKGCHLPGQRLNLLLDPDNHEFIKIMSKATGRSMTEFTNLIISAYQKEHPEIMKQAREFLDVVNSKEFSALNGEK
jgi:hypothetical protein